MENPFQFHGYATGEAFCNRQDELQELKRFMATSVNVLLYSHRRLGKSSLIRKAFKELAPEVDTRIATMHVDLYGTLSERDFCIRVYQALSQVESNMDRLLKMIGEGLKRVRFTIGASADGTPTITPAFDPSRGEVVLEELMAVIERYSARRRLAIALDEFQEVCAYDSPGFEKRLRAHIQGHDRISYVFSGSQRHILSAMFNDRSRAFFKLAETLHLKPISTKDYLPWLKALFEKRFIDLPEDFVTAAVARFGNHPMYVQQFAYYLWERMDLEPGNPGRSWSGVAEEIEKKMIARKNLEYETLLESLTRNQKKALKLMIVSGGSKVFSAPNLVAAELKTAAMANRALKALTEKEIVTKNGIYGFQDIMFKKWLSSKLALAG